MNRLSRLPLIAACLGLGAVGGFHAHSQLQGQAVPGAVVPRELTSYRDVVKKVVPAVVSVEAKARTIRRGDEVLGSGSGVIVDPKGVVLTNNHVVEGADQVEVQLPDGRKFVSRDIRRDDKTDLAVVRVEAKGELPWLELGDSDAMEVGDRVLAVGAPFGLTSSVTHGIVSAKSRNLRLNMYEDFLQTDAPINPGNSGGPLVSLDGKVIGINSAIKSRSGGFQGVGMAISSNLAKSVVQQLLKDGRVKRGYLGVQIGELDEVVAPRLGLADASGVVISRVFDEGPAARAGVQEGDVVRSIAGKPIKDGRDLQKVVSALPLGKPAAVAVVRDGKPVEVSLRIEEQPDRMGNLMVKPPSMPRRVADSVVIEKYGLEVADLTPDLARGLGFKEDQKGVLVVGADRNGVAEKAGLGRGAVITKVEALTTKSVEDLTKFVEKFSGGKGLLLQVKTPLGGTGYTIMGGSVE